MIKYWWYSSFWFSSCLRVTRQLCMVWYSLYTVGFPLTMSNLALIANEKLDLSEQASLPQFLQRKIFSWQLKNIERMQKWKYCHEVSEGLHARSLRLWLVYCMGMLLYFTFKCCLNDLRHRMWLYVLKLKWPVIPQGAESCEFSNYAVNVFILKVKTGVSNQKMNVHFWDVGKFKNFHINLKNKNCFIILALRIMIHRGRDWSILQMILKKKKLSEILSAFRNIASLRLTFNRISTASSID